MKKCGQFSNSYHTIQVDAAVDFGKDIKNADILYEEKRYIILESLVIKMIQDVVSSIWEGIFWRTYRM